jgi:serine/threonine protein kinase
MSKPLLEALAREVSDSIGLIFLGFCGKGAFKETYKAEQKNKQIVALKIIGCDSIDEVRTDREIDALRRCCTPRIAKLIERRKYIALDGKTYDVVLEEYLDGGSLESRLNSDQYTQEQVMQLVRGLVLAVQELYVLRLVHRDIKPANIMYRIGSEDPVLVDFGLVRDLSQSSITLSWLPHGPGTPFYAPPEQLNNDKALIDWRADQFAIGVVAAVAIGGRHPYQGKGLSPGDAVHAVLERRPLAPEFVDDMKKRDLSVLVRMVRPWPVQRYSNPQALLSDIKI